MKRTRIPIKVKKPKKIARKAKRAMSVYEKYLRKKKEADVITEHVKRTGMGFHKR